MNGTAIIKAAMAESKTTQVMLCERMGYTGQGTVSARINSPRMSLDKFSEMLSAMGYDVVVMKRETDSETGEVSRVEKWTLSAPPLKGKE